MVSDSRIYIDRTSIINSIESTQASEGMLAIRGMGNYRLTKEKLQQFYKAFPGITGSASYIFETTVEMITLDLSHNVKNIT